MNPLLKQRLVGAAVIIACAVIFIPMLVDEDALQDTLDRDRLDVLAPEPDSATPITPVDENLVEQTERAARGASRDTEPTLIGQDQAPRSEVETIPAQPLSQTPASDEERQTASRTVSTAEKASADSIARPATVGTNSPRSEPTSPAATRAEPAPAAEPPAAVRRGAWAVQLGSFSSEGSARAIERRVRDAGYPAFVDAVRSGDGTVYRVRVGPELLRANAETTRAQLQQLLKINGIVMPHP